MIISLIAAIDERRGIGKGNKLPWHLHTDLQRFKSLTMGHHLIMGRKTFESIGNTLPGRIMIVVTRNNKLKLKDCIVVHSLEEAIKLAEKNNETEVFIIGGENIFKQSINIAGKIYLTTVHVDSSADVFFPMLNEDDWKIIYLEEIPRHAKDDYSSDFKILERDN